MIMLHESFAGVCSSSDIMCKHNIISTSRVFKLNVYMISGCPLKVLNIQLRSNMQCTRRSLEKLTNHVISERLDFSMDRFKCSSFIKACWSSRLQAVRRMYSLAWVQIPPA